MNAEQLRNARLALGLSQAQLARLLGVDVMVISRWERGVHDIPPYLHLAIHALSHCPPAGYELPADRRAGRAGNLSRKGITCG